MTVCGWGRVALMTCIAAAPAYADDGVPLATYRESLLIESGLVRSWEDHAAGWGARLHVGVTGRPIDVGIGRGRLFTSIGVRLARLTLAAPRDDIPMALASGSLTTYRFELRAGLRWPGGHHYAYVGGGPIVSGVAAYSRAAERVLDGLGYHHGARVTAGVVIFHLNLDATWERVDGVERVSLGFGAAL